MKRNVISHLVREEPPLAHDFSDITLLSLIQNLKTKVIKIKL